MSELFAYRPALGFARCPESVSMGTRVELTQALRPHIREGEVLIEEVFGIVELTQQLRPRIRAAASESVSTYTEVELTEAAASMTRPVMERQAIRLAQGPGASNRLLSAVAPAKGPAPHMPAGRILPTIAMAIPR